MKEADVGQEKTDAKRNKCIMEAVVFAAGYPVPFDKLADTLQIDIKDVRELARQLAE